MLIYGSVNLCRQRAKELRALICVFSLSLGVVPAAYAQAMYIDKDWKRDSGFWNSNSLRIQDVRIDSSYSAPAAATRETQRSVNKSRIKSLALLVVHRTKKRVRTNGKPRQVTVAKALLNVDGERRLLEQGQSSPEGVTLISAGSDHAVVEIDGRRETLTLNSAAVFPGTPDTEESQEINVETVSLWEGPGGFFYADGAIDGYPVNFLLDTGANTVVISSGLARRIGLDYRGKEEKIAKTVGGSVSMIPVVLERVSVGNITLKNVEAGIFEGPESDAALLGMSFLGQVDMMRAGKQMELTKR